MPSKIEVEVRTIYGVPKIYPANEAAAALARIAGTKTLSKANLKDAIALGLEVVEVNTPALSDICGVA